MKNQTEQDELKVDELNRTIWEIRISDTNKAHELSKEAVELSRKNNYTKGLAKGLCTLGFTFMRLSKYEDAMVCLKESMSLFESLHDLRGQATVYEYLGITQRSWGNYSAALELIFKSLDLSKQTNFTEVETTCLYQTGVTYKHLGNYEKALEYLYKSLTLAKSTSFILMEAYALNVIGSVYFDTADYKQALEYYEQGLSIRQEAGDKWGEAGSIDNFGYTYFKLQDYEPAIKYCKQSLEISRNTGHQKGQSNALLHLAEIYKEINDWEQAGEYCQESLHIRQVISDKKGEAETLLFFAELQKTNFKKAGKDELFEGLFKALKIAEEIKAADLLGKVHRALYESYKRLENYEDAIKHLELYINAEKELHKDAISQKVANLEISHRAEETKKESETIRIRNEELTKLNKEIQEQKEKLEQTLSELKATQSQLIQSEKMASLGELTAGIAHEIQNPLNFVNNFSEVSNELIDEMKDELGKGNYDDATEIADDVKQNLEKINHHGKRAADIVKGMLQHSRSSSGVKEPTDINALCDEYIRLCYHGLRAKDRSFNATIKTDFDASLEKVNIIPQDIGRVILNLLTNAFYAVNEKALSAVSTPAAAKYEPTVSISTKKVGDKVLISVSDNGNGIQQKVLDKIFQPFFTTKPTGQGTGLGLSLSYDIIKAHGGEIESENKRSPP